MQLAIVTGADYADLPPAERSLTAALEARGISTTTAIWTDPDVRWTDFDAVLLRTPWDYHERHEEFAAWLDALEQKHVRLVNPVATVRWNMHKGYLRELAKRGVPLPRTTWLRRGNALARADFEPFRATEKDIELVVKPAVSAGAFETFRTRLSALEDTGSSDRKRFDDLVAKRDVVVQELCHGIEQQGELSFIFIDDTLTHSVVKRPAANDFRVQERFGGVTRSIDAHPEQIVAAANVVVSAHEAGYAFAYARVDMVEHDGKLQLMELELIEPSLYIEVVPKAVNAIADGLVRSLRA